MSNNYNTQLQSNNTDLQAILTSINELPEAGGGDPVLQDKTVTPTTSIQTVTADSGYDGLDTVTVNAMPTVTQATPAITVNSSGLITATATQTAGYVVAGSKSATKQLAFQAAKTITPTTTNQTAVSSGYYTGGAITVKGDSNLVAGNIKSGVSIFGVNGTYEGSGGDTSSEDGMITNGLNSYTNDRVTRIASYAFYGLGNLKTVSFAATSNIGSYAFCFCNSLNTAIFPRASYIYDFAFNRCYSLVSISFPKLITIYKSAFGACHALRSLYFPQVSTIGSYAFYNCTALTTVSFPKAIVISTNAFASCKNLISLYLPGSSICKLDNLDAFNTTPIGGYSASAGTYGSIYVPASLLASYKRATNWVYFSSRFVGI